MEAKSPVTENGTPKIQEIVTLEVLQKIINGYNADLDLVSWRGQPVTKARDNSMSVLYALELELQDSRENSEEDSTETLHVMLKTIPRNSQVRADMINEMKMFKMEATVYQEVLPTLLEFQWENRLPPEEIFCEWPNCFAIHLDGKTDYLAFENLKISGYQMGSHMAGLDFNHCSLVLQNLAKFHAISYAKFGGSLEKIKEAFPNLTGKLFDKTNKVAELQQLIFSESFKSLQESLKNLGEDLASKRLEKLANGQIPEYLIELTKTDVEHAVIIHGDFWVNNLMFKYEENDKKFKNPAGIKFLDFQVSMATSRFVDIFYFLMTSVQPQVLNEREEDLLMIYFAEFTSFVERLGVNTKEKGLSWEQFLKEAGKYRIYGVCMGIILAPMSALGLEDAPDMDCGKLVDMENVCGEGEALRNFYKDLNSYSVMEKVKNYVIDHLPKCSGVEQFL